jgi:hypothetical protein
VIIGKFLLKQKMLPYLDSPFREYGFIPPGRLMDRTYLCRYKIKVSFTVDLTVMMSEVNIALDFQGIKWYGLYIIKAAYVFLCPTASDVIFSRDS